MYFHYIKSIKFIKNFVVPTSDACIENQLFGASGMFYQIGSHVISNCLTACNCEAAHGYVLHRALV